MIWNAFGDVSGWSSERAATYAQRIKKKTATARKSTPRPAVKARPARAPTAAPAAPRVESDEVRRLKEDLQRVNQEISKIARLTRPGSDSGRNSQLPEKQEFLLRRLDLERKIRALSKS